MNKLNKIQNITLIAVLISFSVVLSLFDRFISQGIIVALPFIGVMVPNLKIGLANIIVLIIIYNYNFKISLLSVTLKFILVSLFNLNGAPMSFGGTYLSFFVMFLLVKLIKNIKYIYFVSAVGGFCHSLGQIVFGFLYYGLIDLKQLFLDGSIDSDILIYSPIILLVGLITGVIIGGIAMQVNKILNNQQTKEEKQVLYIGHRGSKVNGGVENTKEAFLGGVAAGAHGLECDVRVTKDGQFIIFHDPTFERLTTEDCSDHKTDLNQSKYEDIKNVELTQSYRETTHHGHVCLFTEYLEICKKNNMIPIIEIKWTNGMYSDNNDDCNFNYSNIDKMITLVRQYDLFDKCYVITFMRGCLEYLRKKYPTLKLQALCQQQITFMADWCEELHIDVDVDYHYITKELVDDYHRRGLAVNIWTLNDESLLDTYLEMGVDMITTDWLIKK